MSQPSLLSFIKQLYKEKRELTILEITYLIIAGISFLVSAVIALLNQALGVGLLIIPFIAFLAFSANLIVWALVKMLLEESIKNQGSNLKESKQTPLSLPAKVKKPVIRSKQAKKS
ncbi:hypothetical protein HG470_003240 [Candidatus Saccharibacteria bacterium]|nr:hypothetical protein [Candidatus Saccharibacteria bacterium]